MFNNITTDSFVDTFARLFELAQGNIPDNEKSHLDAMKARVETLKGLDCEVLPTFSTAHLSLEELDRLENETLKIPGVVLSMSSPYGYMYWIDADGPALSASFTAEFPGLSNLIVFARGAGLAYIRLDADGETAVQLPVFDH